MAAEKKKQASAPASGSGAQSKASKKRKTSEVMAVSSTACALCGTHQSKLAALPAPFLQWGGVVALGGILDGASARQAGRPKSGQRSKMRPSSLF